MWLKWIFYNLSLIDCIVSWKYHLSVFSWTWRKSVKFSVLPSIYSMQPFIYFVKLGGWRHYPVLKGHRTTEFFKLTCGAGNSYFSETFFFIQSLERIGGIYFLCLEEGLKYLYFLDQVKIRIFKTFLHCIY